MKSIAFKKAVLMTYLLSCLLFFSLPVSAHSGGTDSAGGHWNRSTGEYHFHHGYSAHQHDDLNGDGIPDCPYDFKNKENGNYSKAITSANYDYEDLKKEYDSGYEKGYKGGYDDGYAEAQTEYKEKISSAVEISEKNARKTAYLISVFLIVPFAVILTIYFENASRQKEIAKKDEEITKVTNKLNRTITLLSLGKDALIGVPDKVTLTYECKPILGTPSDHRPFGAYTVFTSAGGKKYHYLYNCCGATSENHLFTVQKTHEPCRNCVPKPLAEREIPSWYIDLESENKKIYK